MQDELGPKGLQILCFPCDQFGGQELKKNEEIKKFVVDSFGFKGEKREPQLARSRQQHRNTAV